MLKCFNTFYIFNTNTTTQEKRFFNFTLFNNTPVELLAGATFLVSAFCIEQIIVACFIIRCYQRINIFHRFINMKYFDHFHIFGEIAYEEPTATLAAQVMAESHLPYALDMGFAKAAQLVASGKAGPRLMAEFLQQDAIYPGGAKTALGLPTFLGNHDFGRFAMFVRDMSGSDDAETLLARVKLGHALMFLLRGVPTVYYGDEQGFISDGNDQLAREDMFPSKVGFYNDNNLVGSDATTAQSNFDTAHPLYRLIADLSQARSASPALRRGLSEVRAFAETAPGLLAVERHDPETGQRVLAVFNTSASALSHNVEVSYRASGVAPLIGNCPTALTAPGTVGIALPAFGFAACILETDD